MIDLLMILKDAFCMYIYITVILYFHILHCCIPIFYGYCIFVFCIADFLYFVLLHFHILYWYISVFCIATFPYFTLLHFRILHCYITVFALLHFCICIATFLYLHFRISLLDYMYFNNPTSDDKHLPAFLYSHYVSAE